MKSNFYRSKLLYLLAFLLSSSWVAFGQNQTITGKVTDEKGEALIGVNIIVKETNKGTTTNVDGKYTLSVPGSSSKIIYTFVSYESREVTVGNQSIINVSLTPDAKSLSEVIVVGYGVQKKATVSGSVVSVKGSDLQKSPSVNLSNSLAGRMAGVVAVNRSGEPGYDGSSIRIRGANTLNNNDALIVIDGIPNRSGGLDRINPADIETISVLKDASAAIYGARAANGVILITTKKGKTGKPELSYSFNQGFADPTVIPKLTNSSQYVGMLNDLDIYQLPTNQWSAATAAYKASGVYNGRKAPYSPTDIQKYADGSDPWLYPNTDWYKSTLKSWSPQSRHNVQMSGGSENIKYLASLGYQNQDAFYKNSATGFQQYDLRLNLDAKINENVNLSIGILGREEFRRFPTKPAGAIFRMQMRGKPQEQAFWPNGLPGPDIENGENPVVITTNQTGYDRDKQSYFQTNGQLDIKIPWIQGLKLSGTAAIDKRYRATKRWETPWTLYQKGSGFEADGKTPTLVASKRGPAEPRLTVGDETQLNILLGAIATYERKFNGHGITVLAGTNRETIDGDNFNAYRRFFISPALDQLFAGGDLEKNNAGGAYETAIAGFYSRINYNYNQKYLLEVNGRYDGSSRFSQASDKQWGFFPSASAGWIFTKEKIFEGLSKYIAFGKVRASYGSLGNQSISSIYPFSANYTTGSNAYFNGITNVGYALLDAPNPNITWEKSTQKNIGIDLTFTKHFSVTADYFIREISDILLVRPIPTYVSMNSPYINAGTMENKGWELTVNYKTKIGKLGVNITALVSDVTNNVTSLPGVPYLDGGSVRTTVGQPLYSYFGYKALGYFQSDADIAASPTHFFIPKPGDIKYADINNDGKVDATDRTFIGNNFPKYEYSFNMNFSYSNFDLSLFFQGVGKRENYLTGTGAYPFYAADFIPGVLESHKDYWTPTNPNAKFPRLLPAIGVNGTTSSFWITDAAYLRLKNINLSYRLPDAITRKLKISLATQLTTI